jgi:PAS domain S-box-containing protein
VGSDGEAARSRGRLGELGLELVVSALEELPEACTLSVAVRDERGAARDLRLVWMNRMARTGQAEPDQAIGVLISQLWPQMVDNGVLDACLGVVDGGPERSGEFIWTQTATYLPAGYEYRAARVGADHLLFLFRDSSALVRRAKEHEARLVAIVETAPDAIVVIDQRGVIQSINAAGEALLGWAAAELVGQNVSRLMPSPDAEAHDGYLARYLATGERHIIGVGRDVTARRKDGTTFPAHLTIGEAWIGDDRLFTGIVHDLSERERLERQLVQAQKMEAVGRLAGGVAHDFNNLLTVVMASCSLLERTVRLGDEAGELVGQIRDATQRAVSLTRQLLTFSRQQVAQPVAVDLNQLVSGVGGLLRRLLGEDLAIEMRLDPAAGAAWVDPTLLEQVLLNLAVNARDAMPEGGRLVIETGSVEIDAPSPARYGGAPAGAWARLSVIDSGHGMDARTQAQMFDPFFTTKEPGKGTGLGLSTVHGIVEQAGGHIAVTSAAGAGTRFDVLLRPARRPAARPPGADAPPAGGHEVVLLVEDDPAVRAIVVRSLEGLGYLVLTAGSSEVGLELARSHPEIDVLVTDVVMPGMSGRRLAEEVQAARPGLKVLYLSGYTDDEVLRRGVLPAGQAFLAKPFEPEDLGRRIRALLDADG